MIQKQEHLAYILKLKIDELNILINDVEKYYYTKKEIKTEENGSPKVVNGEIQYRTLHPSTGILKKVQKRILHKILRQFKHPIYVIGGIKGKSHITNARRHLGKKYKFKTDIKKFFPSINNKMVYNTFISLNFSPDISRILTILTTYKAKIPQGAPTSTDIANLVFAPVDSKIQRLCQNERIVYTRYIDDLFFSSQKDFKQVTQGICQIVLNSGYKINNTKTKYKLGTFTITGIFTKNNLLRPKIIQLKRFNNPKTPLKSKLGLFAYFKQLKK